MILGTYIFPVGLSTWLSYSLLTMLCLFLAFKAVLSRNSLLACTYTGAFMLSLGLIYFCLDLPYAAGLQIFLSAGPTSMLLLFAALRHSSANSTALSVNPDDAKRPKRWATAAALSFFASACTAVWLSTPFLNSSLPIPASTEIFPHTDYTFFLEDYASIDSWTIIILSICSRYPHIAALLSVVVSALLMISCKTTRPLLASLIDKKGN
ncbi:MAG: hypothetical protein ACI376_08670 [Candidatus Bruticola sp.]